MNTLTQDKIPLKCEICDKEVKSSKGLKRHFNIIHDLEREHQCNICQRIFNVQSQLTSHMNKDGGPGGAWGAVNVCSKFFENCQNLIFPIIRAPPE